MQGPDIARKYTLTPSNFQLLLKFFEFLSACPYNLDKDLSQLFERSLEIAFNSRVKGFAGQERIRQGILSSVAKLIERILDNVSLGPHCAQIIM